MKFCDHPQGSHEWREDRRGRATASDAASIWTPPSERFPLGQASKSSYFDQLLEDWRIGPEAYLARELSKAACTGPMAQGRIREAQSRRLYEALTGRDIFEVGGILTDWGFWASPDGLIADGNGVLEIKTPTLAVHLANVAAWPDGKPQVPREHLPQCHAVMIAAGADWCDYLAASYDPHTGEQQGPITLARVQRNEYTATLEPALREFCKRLEAAKGQR